MAKAARAVAMLIFGLCLCSLPALGPAALLALWPLRPWGLEHWACWAQLRHIFCQVDSRRCSTQRPLSGKGPLYGAAAGINLAEITPDGETCIEEWVLWWPAYQGARLELSSSGDGRPRVVSAWCCGGQRRGARAGGGRACRRPSGKLAAPASPRS